MLNPNFTVYARNIRPVQFGSHGLTPQQKVEAYYRDIDSNTLGPVIELFSPKARYERNGWEIKKTDLKLNTFLEKSANFVGLMR
jgi:hypothetical protein